MNHRKPLASLTTRSAAIIGALAAYIIPPSQPLPFPKRGGGVMSAARPAPLTLLAGALAVAVLLLIMAACAATATPAPQPTAVPDPTNTPTPEPTATSVPPTPTPSPVPTATPVPTSTPEPHIEKPSHAEDHDEDPLHTIREKMETVDPVWTVYFHTADWHTPGKHTPMNDIFELLKLENIAVHDGVQEITPEMIVAAEPDIIIAPSVDSIVNNPSLSGLHMAQDPEHIADHIFVLSHGLSFDPHSPHFAEAVEDLAAFIYPTVFGHEEKAEGGHGHGEGKKDTH